MKKIIFFFLFFALNSAMAHDGRSFPLLKDHPLNQNKISIWVDPDLFKGTFDLFIEEKNPSDYQIDLSATPADKASPFLKTQAYFLATEGHRQHFRAVLPFDQEGAWSIKWMIKQKSAPPVMITLPVEITPTGPTRFEFGLFLLPFLLVGLLWSKAFFTKRKTSL